jgi:hypothetical protein
MNETPRLFLQKDRAHLRNHPFASLQEPPFLPYLIDEGQQSWIEQMLFENAGEVERGEKSRSIQLLEVSDNRLLSKVFLCFLN